MTRILPDRSELSRLDELIVEITSGGAGNLGELQAFRHALEAHARPPCDGFVIGEPVSVIGFVCEGNDRRGLAARCRREDGSEHVVAACDVLLPRGTDGALHVDAYRRWLGLDPFAQSSPVVTRRARRHNATLADIDTTHPVELVVLAVKDRAARCRLLAADRVLTLRSSGLWDVIPGEILVVRPRKQWTYAAHAYLSGEVESSRLDVAALGLAPLRLEGRGTWDPDEESWGDEGGSVEPWAQAIIARGPRPEFEMEQVLPGFDLDDPDSDPIIESNDLKHAGDRAGARKILMELCDADLRCLDAHAHLGNLGFDHEPEAALRHYAVGVRIGELSIGDDFIGLLPWGHIDNRPFLRCMQGFGLCLWRLGRFAEAARVFDRMLSLNPQDNQGVRALLTPVRECEAWVENFDDA
jgi:hypothetical protein